MNVYTAISMVSNELLSGISKDKRNQQQGFSFRGIDDVYNALAPALVKHGLVILPKVIERSVTERQTKNGGVLFYVSVKVEFDFVCAEDGSKHTVVTFGEAMDSGDKATNKAMSIAYKYAAFQAFCIPTEETSIDADAVCHSVAPSKLNESQIKMLTDSITSKGYSVDSTCRTWKITSLSEIDSIQFDNIMATVRSWNARD